MKISPNGTGSFNSIPAHSERVGVNKAVVITGLVLCTLALIPLAAAVGNVDSEAYKACVSGCFTVFGAADRGYDACVASCAAKCFNPW